MANELFLTQYTYWVLTFIPIVFFLGFLLTFEKLMAKVYLNKNIQPIGIKVKSDDEISDKELIKSKERLINSMDLVAISIITLFIIEIVISTFLGKKDSSVSQIILYENRIAVSGLLSLIPLITLYFLLKNRKFKSYIFLSKKQCLSIVIPWVVLPYTFMTFGLSYKMVLVIENLKLGDSTTANKLNDTLMYFSTNYYLAYISMGIAVLGSIIAFILWAKKSHTNSYLIPAISFLSYGLSLFFMTLALYKLGSSIPNGLTINKYLIVNMSKEIFVFEMVLSYFTIIVGLLLFTFELIFRKKNHKAFGEYDLSKNEGIHLTEFSKIWVEGKKKEQD